MKPDIVAPGEEVTIELEIEELRLNNGTART